MPSSYFLFVVAIVALGGVPKGFDEGGFSASITLDSFKQDFHLLKSEWANDPSGLASRNANIASFFVLGAAIGAYIALFSNDRIGRLRSFQGGICLWASGIIMQVFASGKYEFELFARIWGGLGAGVMTVVSPLFLSEIAPVRRRGLVVSLYMVVVLIMLTLGFFFNYAVSIHMAPTQQQYRIVQAIPLFPMAVAAIGTMFISDTPRWLASKGRREEALAVLGRLRGLKVGDPALRVEYDTMDAQRRKHVAATAGTSPLKILREIMRDSNCRNRFLLSIAIQTVPQWTGGNGITYYITDIFKYAGIVSEDSTLISGGAYGAVKLVFTMIFAWGLIDFFGRRKCFLTGMTLQGIAHIYMSVYISQESLMHNQHASHAAVAAVFIYAVGWSIGMCTIPYIYCTEIFPTRMRGVSYAVGMGLHWFNQFAVVMVTPILLARLNTWGAYAFFAAVCAFGVALFGLWAPETKGMPMEKMYELFEDTWWKCGQAKPTSLSIEDIEPSDVRPVNTLREVVMENEIRSDSSVGIDDKDDKDDASSIKSDDASEYSVDDDHSIDRLSEKEGV